MLLKYFSRRDWLFTALIVALIVFQVYLDLEIPGYMSSITLALEQGDSGLVADNGVKMLTCAFVSIFCALSNDYLASKVATSVAARLRFLQYRNVLRFSKKDVDDFSAASLITRSTNDVFQIQQFVGRGLHIIVQAPIMAVWAIMKILGKDWHWTSATAIAVVILVIVMGLTMSYSIKRFKKIQFLMDGINRATRENLDGIRVVRAYNAEEHQAKKFDDANKAMLKNDFEVTRAMAFMFPVTSSLMNFLTMAIYWIGAGLIIATASTMDKMVLFSDMVVFSSYAMQVISAFMMFAGIFRMMPRAMVSSKRITEVIEREPSVADGDLSIGDDNSIVFEHVSFSYPGTEKKVLDDVSFTASPGETVAIIGPTGSGKSTIVSLLMRFYDADEGSVKMGGKDIKLFNQEEYRERMGYVPQQAIIFDDDVRNNVNYGSGSDKRTDEDVWHALEVAQAKEFISKLPEQLDARISQHGRNLSGGQKQRVGIARAVCRKPAIYLLDDCFSALDYITDLKVREALAAETSQGIRIIVAQRIGTIMDADRIIVLNEGKIEGIGKHSHLLESCPLYREIAESQLSEGDL